MRLRRVRLVSILAVCLWPTPATGQQQVSPADTVIFAVSQQQVPEALLAPVVVISRGQYVEPASGMSDEETLSRFVERYYSPGQKYGLLFGGGRTGTVTVKASERDSDCFRNGASAALETAARLGGNVMALATNSDTLGRPHSSRRPPTVNERAAILNLVRNTYRRKGVPASLLSSLGTINLTAADLDADGDAELIGSFGIKKERGSKARYLLFMIAEPQGMRYRAGLTQFERVTNKDIMAGGSIDEVGGSSLLSEVLIDQLDLDGDGVSEVFTLTTGFEGDTYTIYRRQKRLWRKAYEFGNYKCAF